MRNTKNTVLTQYTCTSMVRRVQPFYYNYYGLALYGAFTVYWTQGGNPVMDTPGWYGTPGHSLDSHIRTYLRHWCRA